MFLATADEAISRYESDELIVDAKIPAIAIPASTVGSKLVDITINIFSAELAVCNSVGYKALPIKPIETAANKDIAHQIVAILLDLVSSEFFLIAIKRSKTCGIPKYPSPHESVDIIVKSP